MKDGRDFHEIGSRPSDKCDVHCFDFVILVFFISGCTISGFVIPGLSTRQLGTRQR
jgi:hypothetical protein